MNEYIQYNQEQDSQLSNIPIMAPPPMRQRGGWRNIGRMQGMNNIFPKWLSQYGLVVYITVLAIVSMMYSSYSLPWYYMLSGIVAVTVFFLYGSTLSQQTNVIKLHRVQNFEKRFFIIALVPRLIWMLLIYSVFMQNYGDSFGFENGDATFYNTFGQDFVFSFRNGTFVELFRKTNETIDLSDMGYAIYVGFIYWLTGSEGIESNFGIGGDEGSIIVLRMLKCVLSSFTVLLIYRLAKRNFGEQTGRIAAIFCALWPNFWYYCGTHLKESEMVFLSVLFVEQADQMLRSRQFTAWKVIPVLLIGSVLFTFRTPLALVAFLSLVFSVVMSSSRVVNWGKRIIVGVLALLLIGVTLGNRIQEQARDLLETVQSNQQRDNMEWRAKRSDGNAFAKYAGKSVFAPLIFTIPFPSMVRPFDGQDGMQLLNGGNFVKNIISFFTIFAMVMLLISGKWRDHLLPLSYMLGYLVVLTMSNFAQSERFHQPAMPFELMFAAYGLSIAVTKKKYKRWFTYWCALMFIACIAWNWFKLAGRGLS